ncbi:major pollen allergen Lol p 11-like [Salvia hispanica]|uniref:major pollen allergen Lol p 11-like n=1 Tax=Salvia hispanica TaxID=49212 RepID=UPI002009AAD4|nr:major pollen allergen Lol p 11-like [Salvia hispanica]
MVKILLLLLAAFVASASAGHFASDSFLLQGSVYCDTCRCGYETSASKYLSNAVVRLECRARANSELTYTKEAVTNSAGKYKMLVESDRADDFCDTVLVSSPDPECNSPDAGRDRARVILTNNNGMNSRTRYANALGFVKRTPLASCTQILQQYQESEE